jgi:hypothetical protein
MPTSALTTALSCGGVAPPRPPKQARALPPSQSKTEFDQSAFPCLQWAEDADAPPGTAGGDPRDGAPAGWQPAAPIFRCHSSVDGGAVAPVVGFAPVGSAPTNVVLSCGTPLVRAARRRLACHEGPTHIAGPQRRRAGPSPPRAHTPPAPAPLQLAPSPCLLSAAAGRLRHQPPPPAVRGGDALPRARRTPGHGAQRARPAALPAVQLSCTRASRGDHCPCETALHSARKAFVGTGWWQGPPQPSHGGTESHPSPACSQPRHLPSTRQPTNTPASATARTPVATTAAASGGGSSSLARNYDAVMGSLPKALGARERARVAASTPIAASPALGSLKLAPQVGRRGRKGRAAGERAPLLLLSVPWALLHSWGWNGS